MATTYGRSTYLNITNDVLEEVNESERLAALSPETLYKWVLHACQRITELCAVREQVILRLIPDQEDYPVADTDTPVTGSGTVSTTANSNVVTGATATGTGTISSDETTVTGVGTLFVSELAVGEALIVDTEVKVIKEIHTNLELVLFDAFDDDLAAGTAFDYCTTKFQHELVEGSVITVNAVARTVEAITDPYNLTTTAAFSATNAGVAFTIDRCVTEVPTRFAFISMSEYVESTLYRPVRTTPLGDQLAQRQNDLQPGFYTNFSRPASLSPWQDASGHWFLKAYPTANDFKQLTIYGIIRIRPETLATSSLTGASYIPLQPDYDAAIREYLRAKIYGYLKEHVLRREAETAFDKAVNRAGASDPTPVYVNPIVD